MKTIKCFADIMRVLCVVAALLVYAGWVESCSADDPGLDNIMPDEGDENGGDENGDGGDENGDGGDENGDGEGDENGDGEGDENGDGEGDENGDGEGDENGEGEGDENGEGEGDENGDGEGDEGDEGGEGDDPSIDGYRMPVVRILIDGSRDNITKDDWVDGYIEIDGGSVFEGLESMKTQVKGRGNSTWDQYKKPYALKLDKKQKVLGMPKHKRWCLLANYLDNTHLRNRVAYYIGQNTGLAYTPRCEFAEVYFNHEYLGLYLVTEQIKVDENRVNIDELTSSDISGDAVTGGYLLEFDTYDDPGEAYRFKTDHTKVPVNLKSPDENVPYEQFDYICDYINRVDKAFDVMGNAYGSAYEIDQLVDRASMIDYWIVTEVMSNMEMRHPKSVYFHKPRNGKLIAGPLWDFDWGTLTSPYTNKWVSYGLNFPDPSYPWSNRCWWNIWLMNDASFRADAKKRWNELYPFLQGVPAFIEKEARLIAEAVVRNDEAKWKNNETPNDDNWMSFDEAVKRLKTNYTNHLTWLNQQIANW